MPPSRRAAKKKRRSQALRHAAPTKVTKPPPDLGGRIMWLPKLAELSTPSGLPDSCHDHPVIILSPKPLPNNEVVILMITSFGGKDLVTRHKHNHERRKRAHYLPIEPSPAHPDDPDKNVVLKLAGGGAVLRKNSWVNTETQYRVGFSLLRNYERRSGKLFVLLPESYRRLVDFVGFGDDEVVAGPSRSGLSQPKAEVEVEADVEAEGPVRQTVTPPLTPELEPAVVPELMQVPVVRVSQVDDMERETAHDSDSDTTIVAGDDWESYRTRSQQSRDQQAYYPASPAVSVPPSRSPMPQATRQATNERTSLLHPQPQAITSGHQQQAEPRAKPHGQATTSPILTGYGTLPSSTSRPTNPTLPTSITTEIANLRIRARLTDRITTLQRRRPKHTWYSQLSLPLRPDFVFFGTSSPEARARAREFSRGVAILRSRTGWFDRSSSTARFLRGGQGGSGSGSGGGQYEGMMTRCQARDVEWGIRREMEDELARVARLAPCRQEGESEVKRGQRGMSMLATGVLVFVILLVQATVLAGVVWSVVHFGLDEAVTEWVAKASGNVVGWVTVAAGHVVEWVTVAAGNVVDAFWAVVEFVEWLLEVIFGVLVWLFVIGLLASFCCGGG
ncbi:hypothetical protein B0T20DRAFT_485102 [Sordaria brevicollis]|uniref:Uncharacterized protein n=1 Tax=Sordaria brevicollis TaxID=83679 RepID=A0AAE0PMA2_SORBR|nr:hypothetical protein B0T20DRAFT_485102 [Sordaria brevicollis]